MRDIPHNGDLRGAKPERVARRDTDWQQVEIYRHPVYGGQLVIDGDLQISESDFAYDTAMTAPVLTLAECRRVGILGGGDGGVLRELLTASERLSRPVEQAVLVDIDATVIELCREHLPALCGDAFDDPRAQVIVGDAFAWVDQARELDAVIYDLTMEPVRDDMAREAFIHETLARVRNSLRTGGIFSMQACGELEPDREQLLEEIRRGVHEHFNECREQTVMIPSYGELWTFIAARKAA